MQKNVFWEVPMTKRTEERIVPASICGHNVTVQVETNPSGERGAYVPLRCDYCLEKIVANGKTDTSQVSVRMALSMGSRIASLLRFKKPKHA